MNLIAAKDGSLELELGKKLGEGRDGICYRVIDNNLGLTDMVVKVMFESQRALQIFRHVERLLTPKAKMGFCQVQSLECLLVTPFISREGKCCLLMPRAHGMTLTDEDSLSDVKRLSLEQRVQIACQIAMGIESLHSARIIHADIAGPNIIIDTSHLSAFIIDVDGGGLVDSLAPRIKGHHGDWMAPELRPKNSPPPSQFSDCWSLAVVLHEVITGLSPFYFCSKIQEMSKYIHGWPPAPNEVSAELRKYALPHHDVLDQLRDASGLFKRAFGAGQNSPKMRPTALEWEQFLGKLLDKLPDNKRRCPRCGTVNPPELIYCSSENCATILNRSLNKCNHCGQFVSIIATFCPECGARQT
jgi:serine/threonine protein kinase